MQGPAGLRNALLKHQDAFLMTFAENLMTYALGRRVEAYDMPALRAIVRDAGSRTTGSGVCRGRGAERRVSDEPPASRETTAHERVPRRSSPDRPSSGGGPASVARRSQSSGSRETR